MVVNLLVLPTLIWPFSISQYQSQEPLSKFRKINQVPRQCHSYLEMATLVTFLLKKSTRLTNQNFASPIHKVCIQFLTLDFSASGKVQVCFIFLFFLICDWFKLVKMIYPIWPLILKVLLLKEKQGTTCAGPTLSRLFFKVSQNGQTNTAGALCLVSSWFSVPGEEIISDYHMTNLELFSEVNGVLTLESVFTSFDVVKHGEDDYFSLHFDDVRIPFPYCNITNTYILVEFNDTVKKITGLFLAKDGNFRTQLVNLDSSNGLGRIVGIDEVVIDRLQNKSSQSNLNFLLEKRLVVGSGGTPVSIKKAELIISYLPPNSSMYCVFVFFVIAQKMKFSIKDFFGKCDQIRRKLGFAHIYWRNP